MKRYKRLLFIDTDDTRRAPMAELLMKDKFLLAPLDIESRGLVVLFPEPLDQKAEAILLSNGYETEGFQARPLTQEDIGDDVLLLAMEDGQKTKIWENYENARNVYTLMEFVKQSGDIPPLYGETLQAYGECFEQMKGLIAGLVVELNEKELLGG